jgi:hypothetical protein
VSIKLVNLLTFKTPKFLEILSLISPFFKFLKIFKIIPKEKNSSVFHAGAYLSLKYFW